MFLSVSAVLACAKRMPRVMIILNSLISVFLLVFLLIGCYNVNQRSTHLTSYKFNPESPLYPVISKQFDSDPNTKGLQNVKILSGYMGVCIENLPLNYYGNSSTEVVCFDRKKVDDMDIYEDLTIRVFNIKTSNSTTNSASSDLNILELAHQTSDELVHPYLLIVTTILTILLLSITLYGVIPKLPFKNLVQYILMGLSPITTLLWSIGAIWAHVAIHSNTTLIPRSSMNIISCSKGTKSIVLSWFAFSFMLINCFIIWFIYFRDRKKLDDKLDDVKSGANPFTNRYASDSSTMNSV